MKDFLRQNGLLLVIIGGLLSILLSIAAAFMGGTADPLSNLFSMVTSPVRNTVSAAADWAEGVYTYVFRYSEMENEIQELRSQVTEMEELARQGQDALRENAQLRELLGLQERRRDLVFESARVTAPATSNWKSTLTISKGSNFGIGAGDCVITEDGVLVGIVSTVGSNS